MVVTSWYSIALGMILVLARFAVHWSQTGREGVDMWSIVILCVLGIILSHAVRMALLRWRSSANDPMSPVVVWLWIVITLGAVLLWPWGLRPHQYPLAAWSWVVAVLGFPLAVIDSLPHREQWRGKVDVWFRLIIALALVTSIVCTMSYLNVVRRRIGSVDFFYYICWRGTC